MRRSASIWTGLVLGLMLAACAACCGNSTGKQSSRVEKGVATVPWTVRVGSQGGFTGGGSGHLVHADGTVQAWSRIVPDDSMTIAVLGHADPKAVRDLERAMTDPELLALEMQEQANMTAFLDWSRGGESRHWSWAERTSGPQLPPPLQRAYLATLAAVVSAQKK